MPKFFIVGSARSGTTLLRVMLNAHGQIAVPPESRFVVELYEGERIEVETWLRMLSQHHRFKTWGISIDDVAHELDDASWVAYPDAVEAAFRAFARHRDKPMWGDKTPRYIEQIPLLARLFPRARFIHMVRDGRNVALSYASVPFGPKTVSRAARLWSDRVSMGIEAGGGIPDRYLEIRYEDLAADPEANARKVCGFIGVEFDGDMLDYSEKAAEEVLPRAARYNPRVLARDTSSTRRWQAEMPAFQAEVFEAVAGATLSRLGYERRHPNPRLTARLLASLGRWGFPFGRLKKNRSRGPGGV